MHQVFLFSILLTITSNLLPAQSTLFKGIILDKTNSAIIPYATLEVKNKGKGVATNESGVFELSYTLDSLKTDTLLFKALGYEDKEIAVKDWSFAITAIKLSPVIFNLNPIVVKPNSLKIKKGMNLVIGKERQPSFGLTVGSQVAVYMDNKEGITGIIESASFYMVKRNSKYKAPFRIRIYSADENGLPKKDLTTQNIIIQATQKNAWLKVDLSPYQISVPANGYFIALEWIYTKDKYYYRTKINKNKYVTCYGQALGLTIKSDKAPITYLGSLGTGWRICDKDNFGSPNQNALIHSTIAVRPTLKN